MTKGEIASALRERQYAHGYVDRSLIDALSDEQIIESYITCSCCGKRAVDNKQLSAAIAAACCVDDFLNATALKH